MATDPSWKPFDSWGPKQEAEFRAKLKRARHGNRPDYLLRQGGTLRATGRPALMEAGLALFDEIVRDHPDWVFLANLHQARAGLLLELGRPDSAIEAIRAAIAARRRRPNVQPDVHVTFAEMALTLGREDLYAECEAVLDEFAENEYFPASIYRLATVRALLAEARGARDEARQHARRALDAAAQTESPFVRHRKLGLVSRVKPDWHATLKALSND